MGQPAEIDARPVLHGSRVLVVEDNFLILVDLESALTDAGAEIIGPCRTASDALATLDEQAVTAAILDFQLAGHTSMPVVRQLVRRGIPFLFYTGQLDAEVIRAEMADCRIIAKPAPLQTIVMVVAQLLGR
jgi:DNA-binding response OmpR family regulator